MGGDDAPEKTRWENQDFSGKFEYIAIPAKMGQIPREEVALVNTAEILWLEIVCDACMRHGSSCVCE